MCPWQDWAPASLEFCEAMLCGPLRQPANSISNIGFVFAGIYVWMKLATKGSPLKWLGIASILVGITSAIYHASMTFFFQFFDVSSMFLLILGPFTLNFVRLGKLPKEKFSVTYGALVALSMLAMFLIKGKSGEYIFALWVTILTMTEFILWKREPQTNYKNMLLALGTFLVAFFVWIMDIKKIWCDPHNHWLQGHAIWHLLDALAVVFMAKFYRQFDDRLR